MAENNNHKPLEAVPFKSSQETSLKKREKEGTIKILIYCILIPYMFSSGNVKHFHM